MGDNNKSKVFVPEIKRRQSNINVTEQASSQRFILLTNDNTAVHIAVDNYRISLEIVASTQSRSWSSWFSTCCRYKGYLYSFTY